MLLHSYRCEQISLWLLLPSTSYSIIRLQNNQITAGKLMEIIVMYVLQSYSRKTENFLKPAIVQT